MADKITLGKSQAKWISDHAEHLRYEYDLNPGDYCLDIGSYRGEWAKELIRRYDVQVECFDALDNKAAWIFDGKLAMGNDYLYTSMYADNPTKEYWCVDILKYLHRQVSICKINIEGGEYALINYMINTGGIKNIQNLQVQFHLIEGMGCVNNYIELAAKLSLTHELTWQYPFCWENWKRRA